MYKSNVKLVHSIPTYGPNFENLKSPVFLETAGVSWTFEGYITLVLSPSFSTSTCYDTT